MVATSAGGGSSFGAVVIGTLPVTFAGAAPGAGIGTGVLRVGTGVADVITCVQLVQGRAAFSFTADLFQNLANGTEAAEKCRAAVGKAGVKLYDVNAKALAKCEDLVLKGKIAGPCPDPKASETFTAASAKATAAVCKACGGDDKTCDGIEYTFDITTGKITATRGP